MAFNCIHIPFHMIPKYLFNGSLIFLQQQAYLQSSPLTQYLTLFLRRTSISVNTNSSDLNMKALVDVQSFESKKDIQCLKNMHAFKSLVGSAKVT